MYHEKDDQLHAGQTPKRGKKQAGIILLILSFVLYGIALLIPFTSFTATVKVILAGSFAVLGEIAFWVSCIIIGKDLVKNYRKRLNPKNWFAKSKDRM